MSKTTGGWWSNLWDDVFTVPCSKRSYLFGKIEDGQRKKWHVNLTNYLNFSFKHQWDMDTLLFNITRDIISEINTLSNRK